MARARADNRRAALVDIVRVADVSFLADVAENLALDGLGEAEDGVERGAQLVGEHREELVLEAIRFLGGRQRRAKPLVWRVDGCIIHNDPIVLTSPC
jgi:hypothetical protein